MKASLKLLRSVFYANRVISSLCVQIMKSHALLHFYIIWCFSNIYNPPVYKALCTALNQDVS